MIENGMRWKDNWIEAKANLVRWWRHEGLAVFLRRPRSFPRESATLPAEPDSLDQRWLDASYRFRRTEYEMAFQDYPFETIPFFDPHLGPGSLSIILGSKPHFDLNTVWYSPCIFNPSNNERLTFDPVNNRWWDAHLTLIDEGRRNGRSRFPVAMPDLVENLDILVALRGNESLLFDLMEHPGWVHERLAEINEAYFNVFDRIHAVIQDGDGGNVFSSFGIWGPGKTAKLQCDFSCMISPGMFQEFVVPYLIAQCDWLDFSMYHLDGTTALQHLDALLAIESLDAVQWTPQAGLPGPGDPCWFDLYRKIKSAGKSLQLIGVESQQIQPLLDTLGPHGVLIWIFPQNVYESDAAIKIIQTYK